MALFRITTKRQHRSYGIYIEAGMSVEVAIPDSYSNPLFVDGGRLVAQAFERVYGVDLKKAGCLNMVYLQVERIR